MKAACFVGVTWLRAGIMWCRVAKADARPRRRAIRAKTLFTRRGRTMNCGTPSTRLRKSKRMRDSRSFCAGCISNKKARSFTRGEIVLGRVDGRKSDTQITIFKSLGMAVEDVVSADLVFRRALESGAGTELML